MSAVKRSYPRLVITTHGKGYLIGQDGDQVLIAYVRDDCTDAEMLQRYKGDTWNVFIPKAELVPDGAAH